jgi:O-antigen/teichoic acid export membrane protein
MFRLGLPLAPAWVAKSSLEAVERTLLYQLTSTTALGLFSVAAKLADQLRSLITRPVANVWGVRVMEVGDAQAQMAELHRVLIYVTAAVAAAAVPLGLFAPEILRLVAAEAFFSAAPIIPVLVLAQLAEPANVHFEFVLIQRKKTAYLPIANWATLAVSIAALFLLVPKHGLIGAAFAVATAQVARLVVSATLARRCSGSARLFPWTSYATIVLMAFSASGSGVALAASDPSPVDTAIKAGLCAVFLTAMFLGPAFTSAERRAFAGYCRSRLAGWQRR